MERTRSGLGSAVQVIGKGKIEEAIQKTVSWWTCAQAAKTFAQVSMVALEAAWDMVVLLVGLICVVGFDSGVNLTNRKEGDRIVS